MRFIWVSVLTAGIIGLVVFEPAPAFAQTPSVAQVWALEDDYWRFVRAGDVERYLTLWHEDFIGWPCDQPHPMRKASIGRSVERIRDQAITVTSDLTQEDAQDFGDVVVVHYSFTRVDSYPDGRVEGQGVLKKITHTWRRVGDGWQIVGGMCGDLEEAQAMPLDAKRLEDFAARYTAAWNSQDAARVAAFFAEDGSLQVNDGAPAVGRAAITATAQGFMTAFPDMVVTMDRLDVDGDRAEYHWTLTGTNTGPGGTGNAVRISGHEEWTIGADGLIAESKGHFDEGEYQRQLNAPRSG